MLRRVSTTAVGRCVRGGQPAAFSTAAAAPTGAVVVVQRPIAHGLRHGSASERRPHARGGSRTATVNTLSARRAMLSTSSTRMASPKGQPFLLADIGEGIQEVEIIKFMAKEGDHVEEFDPICEVQSDKATVEITSRFSGTITQLTHKAGDIVKVGTPICYIHQQGGQASADQAEPRQEESAGSPIQAATTQDASTSATDSQTPYNSTKDASSDASRASTPPTQFARPGEDILATPAVRRLSRDHGINLADVHGTGKDGRVTKEDVLRFLEGGSGSGQTAQDSGAARVSSGHEGSGSSSASAESPAEPTSAPLDNIRKAMFKAMSNSLQIPHFAYSDEIDVTALDEMRKTIAKSLAVSASSNARKDATGTPPSPPLKLTMLPFLVKALSLALHDHPLFLSTLELPKPSGSSPTLDLATQASQARLVRRTSHDISIALSSPQGLLTPLLRNVERRSILDLAHGIADLQTRADTSKVAGGGGKGSGLTPADFGAGGTITLSNIGAVGGGTYTHPLIPPTGQLAIGALGRTRAVPRFASECPPDGLGEVSAPHARTRTGGGGREREEADPNRILRRLVMPVSFTGDHRVVEGAEMARLVQRWKQLVEQPSLWFTLLK